MPAPYVLTLNPVVGIDNNITLDPSQELVLTLLPVLKGDAGSGGGSELEAGAGIVIADEVISVDTSIISTKVYAETVANDALTSANAATALVEDLAETNAFKISQLEDGFDTLEQTVTDNFTSLSASKADQSALETLQDLVDTKATPADITAAIAELVGAAPESLDTLYELAAALQGEQAAIDAILTALGNCVRFDAAQTLTAPQQSQARTNIGAEQSGVAAGLVAAITPASIGAATTAQGTKADTAIQSSDLAPVGLSGSFSDLINKSALFNLVYSAYVIGSNTAILASDTLGQMLGKLQAQVNTLAPTTFNQSRWTFTDFDSGVNSSSIFHAGYIMGSIGTGTRVGVAGGVGTQGVLRFISAAAANTGFYVSNASAVPNLHIRPLQGSCCLFVAALPSGGSSRLLTIGFDATVNWSVVPMPTNSVHARFTISGSTVSASCRRSVVGTTTTQGSTVLTDDVYHVFLVQYVADDQVRFVIWNLLTNVKVFDETIVTDTPTTAAGAILFHGVHATGSGTQPLVDIDYIGRGIELPPYFVIPT